MINELLGLDRSLFALINHLPHNIVLDTFFGFFTLFGYFGLLWFILGLILFFRQNKEKKILGSLPRNHNAPTRFAGASAWRAVNPDLIRKRSWVRGLLIAGLMSTFVELAVKNYVARLRPQFSIPLTIVPFDFYKSYSFPSGHAVMSFAGYYILSRVDPKNRFMYLLLAIIISFSRVYLGKHFPSDVIAGAIIGLGIGWSANKIKVKI